MSWGAEHYTRLARREGYASRAVYKLAWIDKRRKLLRRGMRVLDLGSAPGSWAQYAGERVGRRGFVLGVDVQPCPPALRGRPYWQLDVRQACLERVAALLLGQAAGAAECTEGAVGLPQGVSAGRFDVLCSDLAPATTGIPAADAARSHALVRLALAWGQALLAPGGALVAKVFQGAGQEALRDAVGQAFGQVFTERPPGTRAASVEAFLVGLGRR